MQGQQQLQLITFVASSSCLHLLQSLISSKETTYLEETETMIFSLLKQRPKKPQTVSKKKNANKTCAIQECPRPKGSTEEPGMGEKKGVAVRTSFTCYAHILRSTIKIS